MGRRLADRTRPRFVRYCVRSSNTEIDSENLSRVISDVAGGAAERLRASPPTIFYVMNLMRRS